MKDVFKEYPFGAVLSLAPLIEYLKRTGQTSIAATQCQVDDLLTMVQKVPVLTQPIHDQRVLEEHHDMVLRLMAMVFSPVFWETEAVGAMVPFSVEPFHVSPLFRRLFLDEKGFLTGRLNVDEESFDRGRVIRAYLFILEQIYGIRQQFDYHLIRTVSDPDTGLDRHFKIKIDFRFVQVRPINTPKA